MEVQIPAASAQPKAARSDRGEQGNPKTDDAQDLGRVRDILFGSSLRQIEERLESQEKDLQGKLTSAWEKAKKEREAFESKLKEQMESLRKELTSAKEAQTKALEELSESTTKSLNEIEERVIEITDEIDDEKVSRTDLSQMFSRISSELKSADGATEKTTRPEAIREPKTDALAGFTSRK